MGFGEAQNLGGLGGEPGTRQKSSQRQDWHDSRLALLVEGCAPAVQLFIQRFLGEGQQTLGDTSPLCLSIATDGLSWDRSLWG